MRKVLSLALLATCSFAIANESFNFGTVQPAVGTAANANALAAGDSTFAATGGYSLTRVRVTGTLSEINGTTADWIWENRLRLWAPGSSVGSVATMTVQNALKNAAGEYDGPTSFEAWFYLSSAFDPAGLWSYRFYNSVDDAPAGSPDSEITNTVLEFNPVADPTPPTATDLGTINDVSNDYNVADLTFNVLGVGVQWFKFTLPGNVSHPTSFLDIDTGDNGGGAMDTEIAVFDSIGRRIAMDDDDGAGTFSALSFGNTDPRGPIGTGVAGNGRDGSLAAGTYYLAAGRFNVDFFDGFSAATSSTASSNFAVNIRTNVVPEPATMAVLGLGALALVRRRRK